MLEWGVSVPGRGKGATGGREGGACQAPRRARALCAVGLSYGGWARPYMGYLQGLCGGALVASRLTTLRAKGAGRWALQGLLIKSERQPGRPPPTKTPTLARLSQTYKPDSRWLASRVLASCRLAPCSSMGCAGLGHAWSSCKCAVAVALLWPKVCTTGSLTRGVFGDYWETALRWIHRVEVDALQRAVSTPC